MTKGGARRGGEREKNAALASSGADVLMLLPLLFSERFSNSGISASTVRM